MNASSEGNSDSVTIQDCRGLDVATIPGDTLRAALRRFHVEGGAVLVKYALNTEWSLGARAEYLKTTGGTCGADADCTPTNLLYGTKSDAWSLTVTPTYQKGVFFARGELSYTRIGNLEAGLGFGRDYAQRDQVRALVETGILF